MTPDPHFCNADEARRDSELQKLDAEVREAMGLQADSRIAYTDLYDALTALKFHGKAWPEKMTEELYLKIELEAFRWTPKALHPNQLSSLP